MANRHAVPQHQGSRRTAARGKRDMPGHHDTSAHARNDVTTPGSRVTPPPYAKPTTTELLIFHTRPRTGQRPPSLSPDADPLGYRGGKDHRSGRPYRPTVSGGAPEGTRTPTSQIRSQNPNRVHLAESPPGPHHQVSGRR